MRSPTFSPSTTTKARSTGVCDGVRLNVGHCRVACSTWNTRVFSYVFDAAGAQGSGYYKAAKPSGQSPAKPPPPPPPRIESTHGGAAVIFEEEDEDEAGQATVSLEPSPSVGSVDPVRPHILRNACERGSLVRLRRMFAVATFRP